MAPRYSPDSCALLAPTRSPSSSASHTRQQLHSLPTPSGSPGDLDLSRPQKRKRSFSTDPGACQGLPKQQCRRSLRPVKITTSNPITHWVEYGAWPRKYTTATSPQLNMSTKRPSSPSNSTLRHWSDLQKRLNEARIYAEDPLSEMHTIDRDLLEGLSEKTHVQRLYPSCPPEGFKKLSQHVRNRNEASIQTYILPCIVPSPILLQINGIKGIEGLDEEYNAEWIRCQPFISTRPKPDFVVGLSQNAFTSDEFSLLQRYATVSNSAFVTPNICFPFLICEVKSPEEGLAKAERQSIHSAAIAVGSIFSLYESAYGKDSTQMQTDLDGRLLVFSVQHNHDSVNLYGHYATGTDAATRKYYCHLFATTSLTASYEWQLDPYNFVRNMYNKFVPDHVERIKDALNQLSLASLDSRSEQEATEAGSSQHISEDGSQGKRTKTVSSTAELAQLRQQTNLLIQKVKDLEKVNESLISSQST